MLIDRLDHITLIVNDKQKSLEYYESVFELKKVDRATEKICPYGGVWYQLTPDVQLHIWEREKYQEKTEQHFAVVTSDYDRIVERITGHGGRVEPTKLLPGTKKRAYTYDPDGNRIEVFELA